MTAEEFIKIIGLIQGAYPHINRFQDDDVKDVWYECLSDMDYTTARKATVNVIKVTRDFPPDIATIRSEYDELISEEKRELGAIRNYYNYACGSYPMEVATGYAWEEWKARAKDWKLAETFYSVIKQYISECDKAGKDVIDFLECVKTICRDSDGKIYFQDAK